MTPPSGAQTAMPVDQSATLGHMPVASPRISQLQHLTGVSTDSISSPSNHMSPPNPETESSRHSTPATSAAGSDHAHSTSQSQAIDTKATHTHTPSTERQTIQGEVAPSTPPPTQDVPQQDAPRHEERPLASIEPAYFYPIDCSASSSHDGIPVFKPTMQQFQDFYAFCQAIDSWGMQTGIVKVIPPKEWRDSLPDLRPVSKPADATASSSAETLDSAESDELADISKVRIRNAIVQHFTPAGSGVWRQTNITRTAKIWNAKQWADTCVSEGHKGPEMDRMKWKVEVEGVSNGGWGPKNIGSKNNATSAILEEDGVRTRSGKARPAVPNTPASETKSSNKRRRADDEDASTPKSEDPKTEEPTTPLAASSASPERRLQRIVHNTDKTAASTSRDVSPVKPKKNWEAEAMTNEDWRAFDYKDCWLKEALSSEQLGRLDGNGNPAAANQDEPKPEVSSEPSTESNEETADPPAPPSPSDWTPEVCREIESEYWRSLNFGKPPMYGADLKGTLFDDRTKHWNVGKLDNVLTRLRLKRKLPGVNTPYLYWGMWRATFAWHVEDMDLYSINYIHFGAPKQWYAIRQADRQRFESAMAGAFPSDSRRCPHFMRHKSYLASPSFLASHGIRPLKLVHHAGEFVITYPYGYHSGFNLGYNCAESVNFALESWLEIGRKANYCHCDISQNSVRIDVDAMLEESKEMEELERKRELRRAKEDTIRAIEEEDIEKRRIRNEKAKERRRLKKEAEEADATTGPAAPPPFQGGDDFYVDPEEASSSPCVFCPANVHGDMVATPAEIDTNNSKLKAMAGRHAHRLCASFVPETWVGKQGKGEAVCGIEGIVNARFSLKCQICPNPQLQKLYPKIQCTRGKCPRAAHVSCALVEEHGWFVDVCPHETADRLEGIKARTGAKAEAAKAELVDGERLVVLCRTHNPLFREVEEARKADELRERIHSLPVPSMVKIKTAGGMFQALMVEIREDEDEIVIEDEGRPSTVKFQQIILDSSSDTTPIKEEPQVAAVRPPVAAEAEAGIDDAPPAKRRRKATEKANAAAKAASEEAVEASIAVVDTAPQTTAPKRTRKPKAQVVADSQITSGPAVVAQETMPDEVPVPIKGKKGKAAGSTEAKPKRQYKKKAQAPPFEDARAGAAPMETHPPLANEKGPWPGMPMQQMDQHPQHVAAPKRGPRATYAAQPPSGPSFGEQHPHFHQQQPQCQPPMTHGYGPVPMHCNQPYLAHGEQGPYGQPHEGAHGYACRDYPAEAEHPRYAQASVSASPNSISGQRPGAYGGPPAHPHYAQYPQGGVHHGRNPGAQYGPMSGPPPGYGGRSPPLPTYGRPLSQQPLHMPPPPSANGALPDYSGPYHHAAPAPGMHASQPHPGYAGYQGAGRPEVRGVYYDQQQLGGGAGGGGYQDRRAAGGGGEYADQYAASQRGYPQYQHDPHHPHAHTHAQWPQQYPANH